jgi:ribonuclease HII
MAPAKPSYRMERELGGMVAGVDEAGRGPLAGPVVAAAVVLAGKRWPKGIADSKQLPPDAREALYPKIAAACAVGIGVCSVEEIDRLNILRASLLAMRRALDALPLTPSAALVDGNQPPDFPCPVTCVVEGDARCLSIAAASIVAKVTRDRMMRGLAMWHAGYGWETNFGYATPEHRVALRRLGPTPLHRRSFAPVRELLQAELFAPLGQLGEA